MDGCGPGREQTDYAEDQVAVVADPCDSDADARVVLQAAEVVSGQDDVASATWAEFEGVWRRLAKGHSRVSSATAFLAQASSTSSLASAAAAMRAAVAALLRARGMPLERRWRRTMASSAKSWSERPARARWWRR